MNTRHYGWIILLLADAELRLTSANDPALEVLKAKYANVLGWATQGLPADRSMAFMLKTGDAQMSQSRQVTRLSDGKLAKLNAAHRPFRQGVDPALDSGACGSLSCGVRAEA